MWKRANKATAAPPAIGNPTPLETSLDEDSAANLRDLADLHGLGGDSGGDSIAHGRQQARAPPPPPPQQQQQQQHQQQQQEQQEQRRGHEGSQYEASASVETPAAPNAGGANHLPAIRTTTASSNTPPPTATSRAKPLPDLPTRARPLPPFSASASTSTTTTAAASTPASSTRLPPPANPLGSQPPYPSTSMSLPPPRGSARPGAHADTLQPGRLDIPRSTSGYSHEVSPPDSPRTGDGRSSSPNVSPITDGGGSRGGTSSGSRATAIPAPISSQNPSGSSNYVGGWREKLSGPSSPVPSRKDSKPTRWDKYSGEPTDSTRGREGQMKPGTTPYERGQMGNSSIVTAGQQQPYKANLFSQTLRRVGKKDSSAGTTAQPREEWKGPSGRHAIVDAPSEKPQPKQKALPTPSQRRNRQGVRPSAAAKHAGAKDPEQTRSTQQISGNSTSASPTPLETASEDNAEHPKRRIADEFARENRFAWDGVKSEESQGRTSSLPPSQVSSPITPSRQAHSNQPSAINTPHQQNSPATGRGDHNAQSILEHEIDQSMQYMGFSNEPGSRFSSTTYSTTLPDSRPDTPEARSIRDSPVPAPQASVLHRKRPIPATVPYPATRSTVKTPSRKPTPSQLHPSASGGDDDSIFNIPPPKSSPPDEEPPAEVDKVAALEAHINALHKRKMNLTTVINELTNVAQPTSITYDRTSRSEIKKTVNGMTTELASVQKEIHDTGLKLHRALKKRDENMNGEGSGLWVRRVTTE